MGEEIIVVTVRAPASSANLGPGFDVLGMALGAHTWVSTSGDGAPTDVAHPARVAFGAAGGDGDLWVRTEVPMGKGLGFSGSARVAGAMLGFVSSGAVAEEARRAALGVAAELEGHADNAAAAALGGVVVVAGDVVAQVPMSLEARVVTWIPSNTSATTASRRQLPVSYSRDEVVTNLGNVALLVAAISSGDTRLLDQATRDVVHQPTRLARLPGASNALDAMQDAGAWGAWLSGSGPSVAGLTSPADAERVAAALPPDGHAKILDIDTEGVVIVG